VAKKQRFSRHIVHEANAFLCDRCASARVRFPALIVLLLWIPMLTLPTLVTGYGVLRSLTRLVSVRIGTNPLSLAFRTMLFLGLLFVLGVLLRLAWRQLNAVRKHQFHRLPYSSSIARLAIQLRKQELLRSLQLSESQALFLTEDRTVAGCR
jgi:hypothetical protein